MLTTATAAAVVVAAEEPADEEKNAAHHGSHPHSGSGGREVGSTADGALSIKVLGAGCASCHTLLENTKEAVANMGLSVEVEYVDNLGTIAGYGVMSIPALVVNEKVVTMGKVLKANEVETLLRKIGI